MPYLESAVDLIHVGLEAYSLLILAMPGPNASGGDLNKFTAIG